VRQVKRRDRNRFRIKKQSRSTAAGGGTLRVSGAQSKGARGAFVAQCVLRLRGEKERRSAQDAKLVPGLKYTSTGQEFDDDAAPGFLFS